MPTVARNIVTVNTGSSSVKLSAFAVDEQVDGQTASMVRLFDMSITNIGQPLASLKFTRSGSSPHTEEIGTIGHIDAARVLMDRLVREMTSETVLAIGYRLVHGGTVYTQPTRIQDITENDWQLLAQLDPEHTPAAHHIVTQFVRRYASANHVACFDTAFFRDLPYIATVIPLPQKYYTAGVRRYGFHGLSYASLLAKFRERAGEVAMNGRIILAHLGSGSSVTATHHGKPVDTTMGFTPTSGLVMSTRSGDIDPTIFSFLHHQEAMSLKEFDHMVSFESGLLGVSQLTGDMEALLGQEGHNEAAATAVELFVRDVKKSVAALASVLGGVDSLIFSGGIGEQSAVLRARICTGLEYMGITINEAANAEHAFLISNGQSKVGVHVIASDEAYIMATQSQALLTEEMKG